MTAPVVNWSRIPASELDTWLTDAIPSRAMLEFEPKDALDPAMKGELRLWRGVRPGSAVLPTVSSWTHCSVEAERWAQGGKIAARTIPTIHIIASVWHPDTGTLEYIVHD